MLYVEPRYVESEAYATVIDSRLKVFDTNYENMETVKDFDTFCKWCFINQNKRIVSKVGPWVKGVSKHQAGLAL